MDAEIKEIVKQTIEELKRQGYLRTENEFSYAEISSILSAYYRDGQADDVVRKALRGLESDQYYKILPLFYDYGYTIERLAEMFDVNITTISRNKKRLCLAVYKAIQ